jgi:2-polyprenyl-6-methoxyphenol hydroxylase-like FAD-dependent oxidoreductase
MPEGRWAAFSDVVTRNWYRGRAAVIGDAAHAMSPNLGQAACTAMTNSIALAQALDVHDIDTALEVWQRSEKPVVDRVQRYSRTYGKIGTRWPDQALGVRSALIWSLAKSKPFQRRLQFAASYFPSLDAAPGPVGAGR